MSKTSILRLVLVLPALGLWLSASGCASLGGSDELSGGGTPQALQGSWEYLVNNAYSATFTGCTGDAAVLEGKNLVDGMGLAPLCLMAGTFQVVAEDDAFTVVPHSVACSDGSSGQMTGGGVVAGGTITGQWGSASSSGVNGTQSFTASFVGNDALLVSQTHWEFGGSFEGSCDLSPALGASVAID